MECRVHAEVEFTEAEPVLVLRKVPAALYLLIFGVTFLALAEALEYSARA
jgi:hypothetical protein